MTSDPAHPPALRTLELLRAARGGDRSSVEALVQRLLPRVRGLAAVRLGRSLVDLVDCDDIVQEALLTMVDRLDQFESSSEGSLICWLAKIVQSRVDNAHRAARAEKRGGGAVARRADLGVTTLADLPAAAGGRSPSQELAAGEFDAPLERALLGLGATERETVFCRLVLDMDHTEIAAALGLAGADSARALFHKALARLRERLGDRSDAGRGPA